MNREEAMKIIKSNRVYYRDFKHEEFDEAIEVLEQPATLADVLGWDVGAKYEDERGFTYRLKDPNELQKYGEVSAKWLTHVIQLSSKEIDRLRKYEKVEHENKYRIPLPNLITTDGKQQYLTEKDGNWFASRLNDNLKQEWTEDEFHSVPTAYLVYAKEMEGDELTDRFDVEVWRWIE